MQRCIADAAAAASAAVAYVAAVATSVAAVVMWQAPSVANNAMSERANGRVSEREEPPEGLEKLLMHMARKMCCQEKCELQLLSEAERERARENSE